ncbi:MAG: hypothetical protein KIT43_06915 [Bauldia sp.]|nr:hypothetical protein [Bauldia sp.]
MNRTTMALGAVLALVMIARGAAPAVAQPEIGPEFLDRTNRLDGEAITFCIYPQAPSAPLDRAAAELIAEALFLDAAFFDIQPTIRVTGLDGIPISEDEVFIFLTNNCDALLGMELLTGGVYPEWLTFTAAYASIPYVAIARAGTYADLFEVPRDRPIATQSMTSVDGTVTAFFRTLPADQAWRRFPLPTSNSVLTRVLDGTVDAGFIWEPWLQQPYVDPAQITLISTGSLTLPTRNLGMALQSVDNFLRTLIDEAIADLTAGGELAQLYLDVMPDVLRRNP